MWYTLEIVLFSECNCTSPGSSDGLTCNSSGVCTCFPGYTGNKCESCASLYFRSDPDDFSMACEGTFFIFPVLLINGSSLITILSFIPVNVEFCGTLFVVNTS